MRGCPKPPSRSAKPTCTRTRRSRTAPRRPPSSCAQAAAAGLWGVALTDHDSTSGWAEAAAAVPETGVTLIPGMELSTRDGFTSVHMLAYLIDPLDAGLLAETARIRESRMTRAEEIVRRIGRDYDARAGTTCSPRRAEGATIGRPHIADALVARGHVPTAIGGVRGHPAPARGATPQPHYAPDPLDGVRLIRAAGGVPVLAHPGTRGRRARRPAASACASSSTPGSSASRSTTARTAPTPSRGCASSPRSSGSRSPGRATTTARASRTGSARAARRPTSSSASSPRVAARRRSLP